MARIPVYPGRQVWPNLSMLLSQYVPLSKPRMVAAFGLQQIMHVIKVNRGS